MSCVASETDWAPPRIDDSLIVRQRGDNDCGIAALATWFGLIGKRYNYEDLASGLQIPRRGLSMQQLVRIAADRQVLTSGYKFSSLDLAHSAVGGNPWLALVGSAQSGHYVVVRQVLADTVFVLDPALGGRRMKRRSFERLWTGYALLIE